MTTNELLRKEIQELVETLREMLDTHPAELVTYVHGPSYKQLARARAEAILKKTEQK